MPPVQTQLFRYGFALRGYPRSFQGKPTWETSIASSPGFRPASSSTGPPKTPTTSKPLRTLRGKLRFRADSKEPREAHVDLTARVLALTSMAPFASQHCVFQMANWWHLRPANGNIGTRQPQREGMTQVLPSRPPEFAQKKIQTFWCRRRSLPTTS